MLIVRALHQFGTLRPAATRLESDSFHFSVASLLYTSSMLRILCQVKYYWPSLYLNIQD